VGVGPVDVESGTGARNVPENKREVGPFTFGGEGSSSSSAAVELASSRYRAKVGGLVDHRSSLGWRNRMKNESGFERSSETDIPSSHPKENESMGCWMIRSCTFSVTELASEESWVESVTRMSFGELKTSMNFARATSI